MMQFQEAEQMSSGEKVLTAGYKVSGWHMRLKAIGFVITGVILILFGIIAAISLKALGFLAFSVLGIIPILGAWFSWRRSKSLVQGRFY